MRLGRCLSCSGKRGFIHQSRNIDCLPWLSSHTSYGLRLGLCRSFNVECAGLWAPLHYAFFNPMAAWNDFVTMYVTNFGRQFLFLTNLRCGKVYTCRSFSDKDCVANFTWRTFMMTNYGCGEIRRGKGLCGELRVTKFGITVYNRSYKSAGWSTQTSRFLNIIYHSPAIFVIDQKKVGQIHT